MVNLGISNDHIYSNINQVNTLKKIVEISYDVLLGQVGNGRVIISNEASFQLHFSYILKTVGELMQLSPEDTFTIKLEEPYRSSDSLNKSGTNKAKIDIVIGLRNTNETTSCAIELKFFQKANHREPNNRYDVFLDLKNLEEYVQSGYYQFGMFLVCTDHLHYVNQERYSIDTSDFDFRHDVKYEAGKVLEYRTAKPYGSPISLNNSYHFIWERSGNNYFLKQFIV